MPDEPTSPSELPLLTRSLAASDRFQNRSDLLAPAASDLAMPERAVQFGTGAFLRGFIEFFLDEARRAGRFPGRVVAIGSTGSGRPGLLEAQDGLYTLVTRGLIHGERGQELRVVGSLSRALPSDDAWDRVLECARSPELELVFSNTTEVGIVLDPEDAPDLRPPRSFPGKLTAFLHARATAFDHAPERGLVVIPCELIENNGDRLRSIVLELADRWGLEPGFLDWVRTAVTFCNTLVDRIVPGSPPDADRIALDLGYRDRMLTACEPYRLFAIQGDAALRDRLGFPDADEGVVVTPDITPYRERKIRILNGGHTATVPLALLAGVDTVAEAVEDATIGLFVRRVMLHEIAPVLGHDDAREYALRVLDRFANPFIEHALIDITLQSTMKMRVRVVPSVLAYADARGDAPPYLALGFAAWLLWMRGHLQAERRAAGLRVPADDRAPELEDRWRDVDAGDPAALADLVTDVCADTSLWETDLTRVPGFAATVTVHLDRAIQDGVRGALAALIAETAP